MKNKYGLQEKELRKIRERDKNCVYCHKKIFNPNKAIKYCDWATIEHLNNLPPWNNISTIAFCCGRCNSSRGNKNLLDWFKSLYCIKNNINYNTVSEVVRDYIRKYEDFKNNDFSNLRNLES